MVSLFFAIAIIIAYLLFLFLVALFVQKKYRQGINYADRALIYVLALAIYCTAWTFYGNVGLAASNGFLYISVYLGPTLIFIFWWQLLRKMVRLKSEYRLTSIADFLAARYNHSQAVAIIATLISLVGIMPYIALQLKAIITSLGQITGGQALAMPTRYYVDFFIISLLVFFTIALGFRQRDVSTQHPGIAVAIAVQSVVKLLAFLAAGIFVVYFLHHGFADLFSHFNAQPNLARQWLAGAPSYSLWLTYTILSMSAIMFLPRQFHMAVVENFSERHIRTAMWLLPFYFVLITLFSLPIALAGLMHGYDIGAADFFILMLPLNYNIPWLSLFVFLGGLSAALSMIIVSTMAMTIMVTNHLLLPAINKFKHLHFLQKQILVIRWLVVVGIILLAFWFKLQLGGSYILVKIGMISFAAALQFAPAMIGGLFWPKGNRAGAILGLSLGFLIWGYTSLLPAFIKSGWLPAAILSQGLFGLSFLRPEHLFGISALSPLTLTVFLSLLANVGGYVLGSLLFSAGQAEKQKALEFTSIFKQAESLRGAADLAADISLKNKQQAIRALLSQYFPPAKASALTAAILEKANLAGRQSLNIIELAELVSILEKELSGYIGSALARQVINSKNIINRREAERLSEAYSRLLADLKISPQELKQKIDYYQEREKLYKKQSLELTTQVKAKTKELEKALGRLQADKKELENQRLAILNILEDVSESQKKLKKAYADLNNKSQELTALKALGDELIKALDVYEAIWVINSYFLKFCQFDLAVYFVLNPKEEGGFIYKAFLNKKVSESYIQAAQDEFCRFLKTQECCPEAKDILKIIKSLKPSLRGQKVDNSQRRQPARHYFFPLHIREKNIGVIQLTFGPGQSFGPADKELAQAIVSAAALAIDRLQTLNLVQNSKTASLLTSLTDGVVMYNNNLDILFVNPAFEKFVGRPAKEINLAEISLILNSQEAEHLVKKSIAAGKLFRLNEVMIKNKFYEVIITPVRDNKNQIVGGAVILHDITYLKEIDRLKSEFISIASHQLRTPLTAIKLFTEILLKEKTSNLKPEQKKYLANIQQATSNMARLVDDLLNLSRIEAGKIKPIAEKIDLPSFLSRLLAEVKPLAKEKKVHLLWQKPKSRIIAYLDSNLLRQVINNLLANAIRYSAPKGGLVQLKIRRSADKQAVISIQDNGIGIPAAVKHRIFAKFYRADNAVKAAPDGTGLGLYTAKMIIERMGGKIWFRSQEGRGTTFYLKVPISP